MANNTIDIIVTITDPQGVSVVHTVPVDRTIFESIGGFSGNPETVEDAAHEVARHYFSEYVVSGEVGNV